MRRQDKEAIHDLLQKVEKMEDTLQDAQFRLGKVFDMQTVLQHTSRSLGAGLNQVQARMTQPSEDLVSNFEMQLSKYVCERPVNVDFAEVLVSIGDSRGSVCNDLLVVLSEIWVPEGSLAGDFRTGFPGMFGRIRPPRPP